jgi:hypothetical protein
MEAVKNIFDDYSFSTRRRWDVRLLDSEVVEVLGPHERIVRSVYAGPSMHRYVPWGLQM